MDPALLLIGLTVAGAVALLVVVAGTVVKTCARLRPFRFSMGGRGAHSVLELPAGSLERAGLKVGDSLSYSPMEREA